MSRLHSAFNRLGGICGAQSDSLYANEFYVSSSAKRYLYLSSHVTSWDRTPAFLSEGQHSIIEPPRLVNMECLRTRSID